MILGAHGELSGWAPQLWEADTNGRPNDRHVASLCTLQIIERLLQGFRDDVYTW